MQTDEERQELQEALDKLCHWADKWGMEFNVSKCKVMHMGHANQKHDYYMDGQQLEKSEEERDIGMMITSSLKPSAQCAKASRTAQGVLGQITRALTDMCLCGCTSSTSDGGLRPHLEFSTQAWSPWTETDKSCLEKVQQQVVRQVSGLTSTTYEGKLLELDLPTLEERRHQADMRMIHKILYGKGDL